jgi:rSAM/selenodomain-associated transferase 1
MRDIVVIVFLRRPRPGRVKSRLSRALGRRAAARLYAMTLARTLGLVADIAPHRVAMPAAARDLAWLGRHTPGWRRRAQAHGDLGRRMSSALTNASRDGRPALLLGSDLVDFETHDLVHAARLLRDGHDVVFGPAADGGYWLVGARAPQPRLFTDLHWGSRAVFTQSCARARALGLRVAEIACRHDLDRARDVGRARRVRSRPLSRTRKLGQAARQLLLVPPLQVDEAHADARRAARA